MANVEELKQQFEEFRTGFDALRSEVAKVIVGHEEIVEGTLTALIAGGHVLLEGVPGLGKTLLVRTLADALQMKFSADPVHARPDARRPDRHQRRASRAPRAAGSSSSRPGRSSPTSSWPTRSTGPRPRRSRPCSRRCRRSRSPSAARPTTSAGRSSSWRPRTRWSRRGRIRCPRPSSTASSSSSWSSSPSAAEIEAILDRTTEGHDPRAEPVFDGERILADGPARPADPDLRRAAAVRDRAGPGHAPRERALDEMARQYVRYGSSPRGAQAIILAAKIRAILDHRFHVSREDIQAVAPMALRHRLILNFEGQAENIARRRHHRQRPGGGRGDRPWPSDRGRHGPMNRRRRSGSPLALGSARPDRGARPGAAGAGRRRRPQGPGRGQGQGRPEDR